MSPWTDSRRKTKQRRKRLQKCCQFWHGIWRSLRQGECKSFYSMSENWIIKWAVIRLKGRETASTYHCKGTDPALLAVSSFLHIHPFNYPISSASAHLIPRFTPWGSSCHLMTHVSS